jgi:DNA-binding MarR family transcriptional regulator
MAAPTSLLYDVFVLYQSVGIMLGQALSPAPLTPEEYAIYSHILEYNRCTPSEMARDLNMPLQTVSDWIAVLRKRGHLVSTTNDRDRRSYRISLTEEGRRIQRETNVHFERAYRLFIKSLGSSEQEMRVHVQQMTRATQTATATIEKQLLKVVV